MQLPNPKETMNKTKVALQTCFLCSHGIKLDLRFRYLYIFVYIFAPKAVHGDLSPLIANGEEDMISFF